MATSTAALMNPRRDFRGNNDKYARRRMPNPAQFVIEQAISGIFPYDPTGRFIREYMRDMVTVRLNRYKQQKMYYDGEMFADEYDDGDKKTVFNFCKIIADKAVDWTEANGWSVICREGNEQIAELLNAIWAYNNRGILSQRQLQYGAINGDSYMYVTVKTLDWQNNALPQDKWTVKIQSLNPSHVFPIWEGEGDDREMSACLIQMPCAPNQESQRIALKSIWFTRGEIQTWINDEYLGSQPNPLGIIPVVHIPNFELSASEFGVSDIESIMPINLEYNIVANSVRKTLKYHAEPTTLIYGAKASRLEKGANKVWSNLPIDGKVENLEMKSDLQANFEYLKSLKSLMQELSSTPQAAFDALDMTSRAASAVILNFMYQPLIEKTARRQTCHSLGIQKVNRLILMYQEIVIGDDITELADNLEVLYDSEVVYTSPLPRDETADVALGIQKLNAGIWSRAEMIRQLSGVKNHERLIVELIADKQRELMEAYEKQRALLGERPNSLVAFLGSETLSEDLQNMENQLATLIDLKKQVAIAKAGGN